MSVNFTIRIITWSFCRYTMRCCKSTICCVCM